MNSTLTISALTKRFEAVAALTDVTFSVAAGERVALLGHNGAGKSTMMKIVLGLIAATSGRIEVCGAAPGSAEARRQVAYLPENAAFHPALTGLEQIRQYLSLRGENPAQANLNSMPQIRAATDPRAAGGEFYGPRFVNTGRAVRLPVLRRGALPPHPRWGGAVSRTLGRARCRSR